MVKKSRKKKLKKIGQLTLPLKLANDIQRIVNHYFYTKGLTLKEIKKSAKKKKIIYSRHVRAAKQLLELAGSRKKAIEAMDRVAEWAKSRNLDYAIETVFKKWLELDRLKPKEIIKKPYYQENPMVWSEMKRKWYVISPEGEWLEFAGKEDEIEWRIVK
ncbi:MAG: hypothetical protein QME57_03405 [Patescibacteria group bacterium]|nr:hypothetical protein [Patescibacteria group bacterium]